MLRYNEVVIYSILNGTELPLQNTGVHSQNVWNFCSCNVLLWEILSHWYYHATVYWITLVNIKVKEKPYDTNQHNRNKFQRLIQWRSVNSINNKYVIIVILIVLCIQFMKTQSFVPYIPVMYHVKFTTTHQFYMNIILYTHADDLTISMWSILILGGSGGMLLGNIEKYVDAQNWICTISGSTYCHNLECIPNPFMISL